MTAKGRNSVLDEPGRRFPTLMVLAVLAAAGGLGFLGYRTWFAGGGGSAPELATEPVGRATIRASIVTSGIVEAVDQVALRFAGTGRVKEVPVKLGQAVKQGDPLVHLEDDALTNRVATAQSNLATAQIRLDALLKGASSAELAVAEQSVAAAEANLEEADRQLELLVEGATAADLAAAEQAVVAALTTRDRAQRDLDELRQGPSPAEVSAAQQAVTAAEANLASAEAKYDALASGPSAAEVDSAEVAVVSAEQSLASAYSALDNALANVESAEAALRNAGTNYCNSVPGDPLCSPFTVPLSDETVDRLMTDLSDSETDQDVLTDITILVVTNNAYKSAVSAIDGANGNVTLAQASLDAANARLEAVGQPPDATDLEAERLAVAAAEENLTSAQLALDEMRRGATTAQYAAAEGALRSAQASLDAAIAKRDDLVVGADPGDVALGVEAVTAMQAALEAAVAKRDEILAGADQEDVDLAVQQVRLAQLSVEAARQDADEATLRAPFDGTVGAIDVRPGDLAGPTTPAVSLLTPGLMKVVLSVGETDLPSISVGMGGAILFDAIPGRPFIILVSAISLAPRVEQGVVTYDVEANLVGLQGEGPKPSPGMNGSAIVITEQRADVLAVPNRAIRRLGEDLVVDVLVDGVAEPRVIQAGLADSEMTEVTEGLEEGELIVVGTVEGSGGSSSRDTQAPRLPEGVR